MRALGRRKKKLIAAYHFFATGAPARWQCGECRRQGLEQKRRCGALDRAPERRVVWAHNGMATFECPRSYVTAESVAWLEMFTLWDRGGDVWRVPARDVEAMLVLAKEASRGE